MPPPQFPNDNIYPGENEASIGLSMRLEAMQSVTGGAELQLSYLRNQLESVEEAQKNLTSLTRRLEDARKNEIYDEKTINLLMKQRLELAEDIAKQRAATNETFGSAMNLFESTGLPMNQLKRLGEQYGIAPEEVVRRGLFGQVAGFLEEEVGAPARQTLSQRALQAAGPFGGVAQAAGRGVAARFPGLMRFAGPVGAVAGLGMAGFQAWENTQQLGQQYSALTGGTGVGEAAGFEMRARVMALSPFIDTRQAQEIIQTTLGAGLRGNRANTVIEYIAQNVKEGVLDVADSMKLYNVAVRGAGESTTAISTNLDVLQETARESGASLKDMTATFVQQVQTFSAMGLAQPTGVAAAFTAAAGAALPGMPAGAGIPNLADPVLRARMAQQLGVINAQQLPGALAGLSPYELMDASMEGLGAGLQAIPGYRTDWTDEERLMWVLQWQPQLAQTLSALGPEVTSDARAMSNWIGQFQRGAFSGQRAQRRAQERFGFTSGQRTESRARRWFEQRGAEALGGVGGMNFSPVGMAIDVGGLFSGGWSPELGAEAMREAIAASTGGGRHRGIERAIREGIISPETVFRRRGKEITFADYMREHPEEFMKRLGGSTPFRFRGEGQERFRTLAAALGQPEEAMGGPWEVRMNEETRQFFHLIRGSTPWSADAPTQTEDQNAGRSSGGRRRYGH